MPTIKTTITYKGPLDEKVKGMGKLVKTALEHVGLLWHKEMLPHHFGTQGEVAGALWCPVPGPRARVYDRKGARQTPPAGHGVVRRNEAARA